MESLPVLSNVVKRPIEELRAPPSSALFRPGISKTTRAREAALTRSFKLDHALLLPK